MTVPLVVTCDGGTVVVAVMFSREGGGVRVMMGLEVDVCRVKCGCDRDVNSKSGWCRSVGGQVVWVVDVVNVEIVQWCGGYTAVTVGGSVRLECWFWIGVMVKVCWEEMENGTSKRSVY